MAKREITIKRFNANAQGCEILAEVKFTIKHDGEVYPPKSAGHEYKCTYDLTMTNTEGGHKLMNTVIITDQNMNLRALSHSECKALIEGKTRMMKDVYKGRGQVRVVKEMTPTEIAEKAKNDPVYRKQLMDSLMAMQDEIDGVEE